MEKYTISKNKKTIFVENIKISFNDKIETVLTFSDVLIVHLKNVDCINDKSAIWMRKQPINNIYGIDSRGKIVWNIKQITTPHLGNQPDEYYSGAIKISENILRVMTFRCITFDIDINTLEIVNKTFTK